MIKVANNIEILTAKTISAETKNTESKSSQTYPPETCQDSANFGASHTIDDLTNTSVHDDSIVPVDEFVEELSADENPTSFPENLNLNCKNPTIQL